MIEEIGPFIIELRDIVTDSTAGAIASIICISLKDDDIGLTEACEFCAIIRIALSERYPWKEKTLACCPEGRGSNVIITMFGAWIPSDLFILVRQVHKMVRSGVATDGSPIDVTERLLKAFEEDMPPIER